MDLKVIHFQKIWLTLSTTMVVVSIVVIGLFGLKQGIDFTGGTLLEVSFEQKPDLELVKEQLSKVETEAPLAITAAPDATTDTTVATDTTSEPAAEAVTDEATEPIAEETTAEDVVNESTEETAVEENSDAATSSDTATLGDTAPAETPTAEPVTDEAVTTEPVVEQPLTEYSELNPEGMVEIGTPVLQLTSDTTLMIRIKYINEDTHKQILERLKAANNGNAVTELRYENIGPVIGKTLKQNAMISLVLAIIFIVLFISFAFRKMPRTVSSFKFGITAVIALVHDVVIIVGIFALLGRFLNIEIDTLFVTALLTVMGFSVHDTIVVFDRIRENLFRSKGKTLEEIANDSINQTLARSVNTSLTTLITLFALFILGGESIKWFVFALIAGIIVGTYSSIFLATPILVIWHKKK